MRDFFAWLKSTFGTFEKSEFYCSVFLTYSVSFSFLLITQFPREASFLDYKYQIINEWSFITLNLVFYVSSKRSIQK